MAYLTRTVLVSSFLSDLSFLSSARAFLLCSQSYKPGDAKSPARRELLSNCVTNVEPSSYPTKASSYPTKATKRQPKGTNKMGGLAYPELLDAL